jgi:peptidoglycan/xylan/chitin deacetylase (PgdA/CDA1 family)
LTTGSGAVAGESIPILLYHSVADRSEPGLRRWTVPPSTFAHHIRALVDSERTPLSVTRLAAALRGEYPMPIRPVAITFDDGFRDTPEAVALLAAAGIPATVFITTGFLDGAGMMRGEDVAELAASGDTVEVGAHGITHRRLDELSRVDAHREIAGSRSRLEQITGRECRSFAYPHGCHDRATIEAVRAAGFSSAVAVKNALSHTGDDIFALARVTIQADTTPSMLEALLAAEFQVAPLHERWLTRGYRHYRRLRRRLAGSPGTTTG